MQNGKLSSLTQAFAFNISGPEIFAKLCDKLVIYPWTMLLHSGNSNHTDSRFDILVSHPIATIVTHLNYSTIETNPTSAAIDTELTYLSHERTLFAYQPKIIKQYKSADCPFECLDNLIQSSHMSAVASNTLPFQGGALGLFSYDLGRTQEVIPNISQKIDPLPAMSVGIYDFAFIKDNKLNQLSCVIQASTQEEAQKRFNTYLSEIKELIDEVSESSDKPSQLEQSDPPFELTSEWQSTISKEKYHEQFQQVQDALKAGECYQINLTQAFYAEYQGSEWRAFQDLLNSNLAPFSAYCHMPEGKVLSASPERFLLLNNRQVVTKPIKGTIPRMHNTHEDNENKKILAASIKNRAENVMIVDLLRNDLGKIAKPGTVQVPKLFDIESFPAVHHLVSTVSASLKEGVTAVDLLKACFPGGSITGAPKVSAMQKIEQIEPTQRSIYCGSIAYISACGRMDSNIAIRTLIAAPHDYPSNKDKKKLTAGKLICFAGGGIVLDSIESEELEEVYAKLSKILTLWQKK